MNDKDFFENNLILQTVFAEENKQIKEDLLAKPIWKINDLLKFPKNSNDPLIENLLWKGQLVFIIAREKVGKSILTQQICCSLSSGCDFLDTFFISKKRKVLYVQLEGSREETQDNISSMLKIFPIDEKYFFYSFKTKLWLNHKEDIDLFIQEVDQSNLCPDLIVFDPLYQAKRGSISDDNVASNVITGIREIIKKYECAVIMVHHEHKPIRSQDGYCIDEGDDSIAGSYVFKANADQIIRIIYNKKTGVREMRCDTQRSGQIVKSIKMRLVENPLHFIPEENMNIDIDHIILGKIKLNGEVCQSDINKDKQFSEYTLSHAFTRLRKNGVIVKSRTEGKKTYYKLAK